jgi:hypothetical protein
VVSERERKPDYFRDARRTFGLIVIVLYWLLVVAIGYALFALLMGDEHDAVRDPIRWTVWAISFVPMTAAVVAAVRNFRTDDRRRSWKLTGLCGGLFLTGILMIVADGVARPDAY